MITEDRIKKVMKMLNEIKNDPSIKEKKQTSIVMRRYGFQNGYSRVSDVDFIYNLKEIHPIHARKLLELWYKRYNDVYIKKNKPVTKVCSSCGKELPIDSFWKNSKTPDGYQIWCKDCTRKSKKKSKKRNKNKNGWFNKIIVSFLESLYAFSERKLGKIKNNLDKK